MGASQQKEDTKEIAEDTENGSFVERLVLMERHMFLAPQGDHAGLVLVDTGAPTSSSRSGELTWMGQTHVVQKGGGAGYTFDSLTKEIGLPVDALLGMDLMTQADSLLFQVGAKRLVVNGKCPAGVQPASFTCVKGSEIPVIIVNDGRVGSDGGSSSTEKAMAVIFDTGAQYGYVVDSSLFKGLAPQKGFRDFSPMFGDLLVEKSYELPLKVQGREALQHAAQAPERLSMFLRAVDVSGIFGPSILRHLDLWLEPKAKQWAVQSAV